MCVEHASPQLTATSLALERSLAAPPDRAVGGTSRTTPWSRDTFGGDAWVLPPSRLASSSLDPCHAVLPFAASAAAACELQSCCRRSQSSLKPLNSAGWWPTRITFSPGRTSAAVLVSTAALCGPFMRAAASLHLPYLGSDKPSPGLRCCACYPASTPGLTFCSSRTSQASFSKLLR